MGRKTDRMHLLVKRQCFAQVGKGSAACRVMFPQQSLETKRCENIRKRDRYQVGCAACRVLHPHVSHQQMFGASPDPTGVTSRDGVRGWKNSKIMNCLLWCLSLSCTIWMCTWFFHETLVRYYFRSKVWSTQVVYGPSFSATSVFVIWGVSLSLNDPRLPQLQGYALVGMFHAAFVYNPFETPCVSWLPFCCHYI